MRKRLLSLKFNDKQIDEIFEKCEHGDIIRTSISHARDSNDSKERLAYNQEVYKRFKPVTINNTSNTCAAIIRYLADVEWQCITLTLEGPEARKLNMGGMVYAAKLGPKY